MIEREWCERCGGSGHDERCACYSWVDAAFGCCGTCGGEGLVTVGERPDVSELWVPPSSEAQS